MLLCAARSALSHFPWELLAEHPPALPQLLFSAIRCQLPTSKL